MEEKIMIAPASTMEDLKVIAENMRQRRKELGMSQSEVGKICGMSGANYGEVERGQRNITLETFAYIAFALRCRADVLLAGTSFSSVLMGESPELTYRRIKEYLKAFGIDASIHPAIDIDDDAPVILTADSFTEPWLQRCYEHVHNQSLTLKKVQIAIDWAESDTRELYKNSMKDYQLERLRYYLFEKPYTDYLERLSLEKGGADT